MAASPPPSTSPKPGSTGSQPTSPVPSNPLSNVRDEAPPPSTQAPPPPSTGDAHPNPKIAELQIMFPTVEVGVIEMILESCGGSQDRAIEQLLSMTDPNFQPDELAHVRQEEASQLDLDADFARSLQLEDEQQLRQGGRPLPYQPRVRRRPPPGQYAQGQEGHFNPSGDGARGGENPPGMLAMEDKLNQFAEAGKQTFSSLFNRAKARYNEFQQTAAANTAAREEENRQRVGQDRMGAGWRSPQGESYGTPTPGGGRGGQQNVPNHPGGLWGDESSRSTSFSSQSADQPPPPKQSARWQPSDAYDDPLPTAPGAGATGNKIEVTGRRSPAVAGERSSTPSGKIDPAKLGILPKKRVDLLSTSPPQTTPKNQTTAAKAKPSEDESEGEDDDDPNPGLPSANKSVVSQIPTTPPAGNERYSLGDSDDDLEYTQNPFDRR